MLTDHIENPSAIKSQNARCAPRAENPFQAKNKVAVASRKNWVKSPKVVSAWLECPRSEAPATTTGNSAARARAFLLEEFQRRELMCRCPACSSTLSPIRCRYKLPRGRGLSAHSDSCRAGFLAQGNGPREADGSFETYLYFAGSSCRITNNCFSECHNEYRHQ